MKTAHTRAPSTLLFRGNVFVECHTASEVLQKRTYKAFGDIEGVHVIADDMIIAAATEEEHDQILLKVLKRAREQNIKFTSVRSSLRK